MPHPIFKPDLSALRISTLSDARNYRPPCVTCFEKDGHTLYHINARHTGDPNSTTYRTIAAALEIFKPHSVVIETGGWPAGPNFPAYIRQLEKEHSTPETAKNEAAYTILLARQMGINNIVNGEPTDAEVYKKLLKAGHTSQIYQCFMTLQSMTSWIKTPEASLQELPNFFKEIADDYVRSVQIPPDEQLDFATYQAWFQKNYPDRPTLMHVNTNDTAPEPAPLGTQAQQISYDIERLAREPHIIGTITAQLKKDAPVLVVYGAGHQRTEQPVFEKMLGPANVLALTKRNRKLAFIPV